MDAALSDFFPIRLRRAELRLAGNSGTPPSMYEILFGVATLSANPERRVRVSFNDVTNKIDVKTLHHASDIAMPDGSKARQIIIDARDEDELPKIIQRERKRRGYTPMSDERLADEVLKVKKNTGTTENPEVRHELRISFAYVRHAMMKIAYELAFLWLGESYLDDPTAAKLRAAICDPDLASTHSIPGDFCAAEDCGAFRFWMANKTHHMAYAFAVGESITIAVRVFDIQAAIVTVTKDATRYLTMSTGRMKLPFLTIEPTSGRMEQKPFADEVSRLARAADLSELPLY